MPHARRTLLALAAICLLLPLAAGGAQGQDADAEAVSPSEGKTKTVTTTTTTATSSSSTTRTVSTEVGDDVPDVTAMAKSILDGSAGESGKAALRLGEAATIGLVDDEVPTSTKSRRPSDDEIKGKGKRRSQSKASAPSERIRDDAVKVLTDIVSLGDEPSRADVDAILTNLGFGRYALRYGAYPYAEAADDE